MADYRIKKIGNKFHVKVKSLIIENKHISINGISPDACCVVKWEPFKSFDTLEDIPKSILNNSKWQLSM